MALTTTFPCHLSSLRFTVVIMFTVGAGIQWHSWPWQCPDDTLKARVLQDELRQLENEEARIVLWAQNHLQNRSLQEGDLQTLAKLASTIAHAKRDILEQYQCSKWEHYTTVYKALAISNDTAVNASRPEVTVWRAYTKPLEAPKFIRHVNIGLLNAFEAPYNSADIPRQPQSGTVYLTLIGLNIFRPSFCSLVILKDRSQLRTQSIYVCWMIAAPITQNRTPKPAHGDQAHSILFSILIKRTQNTGKLVGSWQGISHRWILASSYRFLTKGWYRSISKHTALMRTKLERNSYGKLIGSNGYT